MLKALRVLTIIAIVTALIEIFDLIATLIQPIDSGSDTYAASYAKSVKVHWLVYWPSGLVILIIGIIARRRVALLGNALAIGGVYLMLLGNNGGLWATGYEIGRLSTAVVTVVVLIWIANRMESQATNQ